MFVRFIIISIVGWVAFFLVIFLAIRKTKKTQELMAAYDEATKGIDRQKEIDAELAYKKHMSQKRIACIVLMVVFALGFVRTLLQSPLILYLPCNLQVLSYYLSRILGLWGFIPSLWPLWRLLWNIPRFAEGLDFWWFWDIRSIFDAFFALGMLAFAIVKMRQYKKMKAPKDKEATSSSLFD